MRGLLCSAESFDLCHRGCAGEEPLQGSDRLEPLAVAGRDCRGIGDIPINQTAWWWLHFIQRRNFSHGWKPQWSQDGRAWTP